MAQYDFPRLTEIIAQDGRGCDCVASLRHGSTNHPLIRLFLCLLSHTRQCAPNPRPGNLSCRVRFGPIDK